jgi:UDP-glucose 4-epimerase
MKKKILVTGGCGYIGSHVTRQLSEAGYLPVVLDNLSTGFREALIHGEELVQADLADGAETEAVLKEHEIDTVMHFAASIIASESLHDPLAYYRNNMVNTLRLLTACDRSGVRNFIFSSSAAVYGIPPGGVASEDSPTEPINPYGSSKLMVERIIEDLSGVNGMRFVILRYFNVAGADPHMSMGQRTKDATHLLKVCCEAAMGARDAVAIFGTDHVTPDGTGVRDYIHVEDLARAHLDALAYLERSGSSIVLNVGYGTGHSVREMIAAVREVSGRDFKVVESARRPGDPSMIIARAERIRQVLGWSPRYNDLCKIVEDTWRWELKMNDSSNVI